MHLVPKGACRELPSLLSPQRNWIFLIQAQSSLVWRSSSGEPRHKHQSPHSSGHNQLISQPLGFTFPCISLQCTTLQCLASHSSSPLPSAAFPVLVKQDKLGFFNGQGRAPQNVKAKQDNFLKLLAHTCSQKLAFETKQSQLHWCQMGAHSRCPALRPFFGRVGPIPSPLLLWSVSETVHSNMSFAGYIFSRD